VNSLTEEQVKKMKDSVEDEYRVNMILDNLPTAMVRIREDAGSSIKVYERGFPVGFKAGAYTRPLLSST
jgi:transmembrane 9 superfamily protein 2/4